MRSGPREFPRWEVTGDSRDVGNIIGPYLLDDVIGDGRISPNYGDLNLDLDPNYSRYEVNWGMGISVD